MKNMKYILNMFPYPSGRGLHVGHLVGYLASDILSRYYKLKGLHVIQPMGWDAFGLPTEQYALKVGRPPAEITQENIYNFKKQLNSLTFDFSWNLEINTSDPSYYRWTQWIATLLYESWFNPETNKAEHISTCKGDPNAHRLLYRGTSEVNWCPDLNTVLADSEVINGRSERGGHPVEKKVLEQWMLRITPYKQRLVDDLNKVEWAEEKTTQKNWINDRLRDVVFSRQRLWGEPFPITKAGKVITDLPVLQDKFTDDPNLYQETMPSFAGSNWYFFRYLDPNNWNEFCDKELQKIWLPVDVYIGGKEHTTGHVLYARFITKVLYDLGFSVVDEPFAKIVNVGILLGPDGKKMSKSSGTAIEPERLIQRYGADAVRLHVCFLGPLEKQKVWKEDGISGCVRFLDTFKKLSLAAKDVVDEGQMGLAKSCVEAVDRDIEKMSFNTCPPRFMTFVNAIKKSPLISREALRLVHSRLNLFCPSIEKP